MRSPGRGELFAIAYLIAGGVANAAPGSFADAFFFSVQTMGTIGYGSMYPASRAANVVVVAESVAGLLVTALATGLVFARFSQLRPRVAFSSRIAIGPIQLVSDVLQHCEALMLQGRVQFLLCHSHHQAPMRLDSVHHPSAVVGSDVLIPVSAPAARSVRRRNS
jgi:hypothetical protein